LGPFGFELGLIIEAEGSGQKAEVVFRKRVSVFRAGWKLGSFCEKDETADCADCTDLDIKKV
jgi:hypothetical protein